MGIAADFVLIVVAGLVGALAARALRLPLLVGYVAAGVLVGPYTAGPRVVQIDQIELLAEIGVALLLFALGLEISLRDLQPVRRVALLGGPIQILLTGAVTALLAVWALGIPVTEATWLGAMVSVSSTMVVIKTISAQGMTSTLASRVMIGLLVVQDLAVLPMLIILPQLGDFDAALPRIGRAVLVSGAFLAATVVIGTRLLPQILSRALMWGSRELFLVSVVAVGIGVGYAMSLAGLSFALGAFVAGLVLSESEFSHQALSDIVPLRDIFGLLFFVTVGMLFDPRFVVSHPIEIVAGVALIFVGKALIIGGIARAFGYVNMAPWIIGLGLSQIGEFSFVLLRSGLSSGMVSESIYNLALSWTVLTMALSPLVAGAALPLGRAWRKWRPAAGPSEPMILPEETLTDHVVVGGYGRTGRAVAHALRDAKIPLALVELDHSLFGDAVAAGLNAIWGDASREEVLRAAGIERARMLVITTPDQTVVRMSAATARRLNPRVTVIARARRAHHVAELRDMGVDVAVQPEFEGGVEMVRAALVRCGQNNDEALRVAAKLRSDLYGEAT